MKKNFDDVIEKVAYDYLDNIEKILLSGDEMTATAMLKIVTGGLSDIGWDFGAFLNHYEETLGKLWDKRLGLYADEYE